MLDVGDNILPLDKWLLRESFFYFKKVLYFYVDSGIIMLLLIKKKGENYGK
tara:strand:- start:14262 stop:14414 length:153 start_codon:yes stop_codon:yes gene_type:complete